MFRFWPIWAIWSRTYVLFSVLFTCLNNVAVYQNWQTSGMRVCIDGSEVAVHGLFSFNRVPIVDIMLLQWWYESRPPPCLCVKTNTGLSLYLNICNALGGRRHLASIITNTELSLYLYSHICNASTGRAALVERLWSAFNVCKGCISTPVQRAKQITNLDFSLCIIFAPKNISSSLQQTPIKRWQDGW